ncbi:MAG: hypothetical protein KME30_01610 [Iphinoe sp. HA4291-MV1]|jgi:hypothetical protein|nr:hypothetical protein [Iphinoe sp. HA4291-MV1]
MGKGQGTRGNAQFTVPSSQFPIPIAQFPIPNFQSSWLTVLYHEKNDKTVCNLIHQCSLVLKT